jgi:hypothetical protein
MTGRDAFDAAVVAELRRRLVGPLPGEPPGSRYLRGVGLLATAEPDTVMFWLDVVVYGVASRETHAVPEWSTVAVGSPSALGRALAAEITMLLTERLSRARVVSR